MRKIAVVILVMVGCGGDDDDDKSRQAVLACEQVRDHLVDLRLVSAAGVDRAAHRTAMRAALGEDFVAGCQRSMTQREISCVMYALDLDAATACTSSTR